MAAAIFARFRMMPASARSLRTFFELYFATLSGSNPSKAFLNASRFFSTVSQESPACTPSRTRNSNSFRSSCSGTPHSASWYSRRAESPSAHSQRLNPAWLALSVFFIRGPPCRPSTADTIRHIETPPGSREVPLREFRRRAGRSVARIDELGDALRRLAGFLDHRKMPGVFDCAEAGSGDSRRGFLCGSPRELNVMPAGEDQCGHVDSSQGCRHRSVAPPQGETRGHEPLPSIPRLPGGDDCVDLGFIREPRVVEDRLRQELSDALRA